MDTPCSTRTIRRHLNNEKTKHKKRIHHPRLTVKHKEKQLEYVHQYQTISAKDCRKVVFSDEKKFNLDVPNGFQKFWRAKNFLEENYSTRYSGGGSLMILWEASHLKGVCQTREPSPNFKLRLLLNPRGSSVLIPLDN